MAGESVRPSLLFVCTANMCRSPLAAALARRALSDAGAEVASAGFLPGGHQIPADTVRVATGLGVRLESHQSTQLTPGILALADLVITMTRQQARDLVADDAELWPRVFTIKQFARWITRHRPPAAGLSRAWLEAEASGRHPVEMLGADPDDDVIDPMGHHPRVWNAVAHELVSAVDEIAAALRPRLSSPSTP